MGQYYKAVFVNENKDKVEAFISPYNYGNGAKLMEHSWVGNEFVQAAVNYLNKIGGGRLIWAGDYGDEVLKVKGEDTNYYCAASEENGVEKITDPVNRNLEIRFLINEDKMEYIDLWDLGFPLGGANVHPLPLLCADGNGRGGGDYYGVGMDYVGSWAGDFIRAEKSDYELQAKLQNGGYEQIDSSFTEQRDIFPGLCRVKYVIERGIEENIIDTETAKNMREELEVLLEKVKELR